VIVSGQQARLVVAVSTLTADSEAVVRVATKIAEHTDARLRVVHPLGVVGESLRKALFGAPPLQQRVESAARRLANQVESALDGADIAREVVLDHNGAGTVIVQQAATGVADLVVLAADASAADLLIAALAGIRSPLLFMPRFARIGMPCIVQALTPGVTPDAFLRAQRWLRILQPLLNASSTEPGELDILLCPETGSEAIPGIDSAAAALRAALDERDPSVVVALLPAADATAAHEFARRMLGILLAEARCPVLAVPALPAIRAVWTPPAFQVVV